MSRHREKQELIVRRAVAKAEGKCTSCFERPAGLTKDGLKGVKCTECAAVIAERRRPKKYTPPPVVVAPAAVKPTVYRDWWDVGNGDGFLDTKEFKAYCRLLSKVVELLMALHNSYPTNRQIKDLLGHRLIEKYHADALDTLTRVSEVGVIRYAPAVIVKKIKGEYYRNYAAVTPKKERNNEKQQSA